ncbi:hypothetical protein HOY80DRAFT_1001132 [Tuber brumale]|nr:hypothetical protein HOY80DRAFT_1001132 [Tuber brumale]
MGNSQWVEGMDQFLVEALLKRVENSDRMESGFKKPAWGTVVVELNAAYKDTLENPITVGQLKSEFEIVHTIRQCSGFGCDAIKGIPTASGELWKTYIQSHKDVAKFIPCSAVEEEDNPHLSQDSITSGLESQDYGLGMIDPAFLNGLDAPESPYNLQFSPSLKSVDQPLGGIPYPATSRCQRNESPSQTSPSRKCRHTSHSSPGSLAATLVEANEEARYQHTHGIPSKQERTVRILEKDCAGRYSTADMVKSVC